MIDKLIVFILGLCIISCSYNDEPQLVEVENIEVMIPGHMKKQELADDAMIEYANRYRNLYVVVIKDKEKLSMPDAISKSIKRLTSQVKKVEVDTLKHSSDTSEFIIKSYFKDEKKAIFYFHKIINHEGYNYIMTVWTRGKERKDKYKSDIDLIFNSLKIFNS